MFKVVNDFRDVKDNYRLYKTGEIYPADGVPKPSKARIAELAKGKNKYNKVFIEEVPDSTSNHKAPLRQNSKGKNS